MLTNYDFYQKNLKQSALADSSMIQPFQCHTTELKKPQTTNSLLRGD